MRVTAPSDRGAAAASAYGSMSVAFSGQMHQVAAAACVPARDVGGELAGRLDVVVQHRARAGRTRRGPARGHVALDDARRSPVRPPVGHRDRQASSGHGDSAGQPRAHGAGPRAADRRAGSSAAPDSATAKVTSGAPPSAASGVSGVGLAEREPPPREAAERHAVAQRRLARAPTGRRPTAASRAAAGPA